MGSLFRILHDGFGFIVTEYILSIEHHSLHNKDDSLHSIFLYLQCNEELSLTIPETSNPSTDDPAIYLHQLCTPHRFVLHTYLSLANRLRVSLQNSETLLEAQISQAYSSASPNPVQE